MYELWSLLNQIFKVFLFCQSWVSLLYLLHNSYKQILLNNFICLFVQIHSIDAAKGVKVVLAYLQLYLPTYSHKYPHIWSFPSVSQAHIFLLTDNMTPNNKRKKSETSLHFINFVMTILTLLDYIKQQLKLHRKEKSVIQ